MTNVLKPIEPNFKSFSGKNYMEFTFQEENEIIVYQLEMIANNKIPGLLKSNVIRVDGEIKLSFDITSLIPIKKLFERKEFNKRDFYHILVQIISLLELLEEYLLDSGGVVFDSRLIFVDPQNLNIEFAYVPIKGMPMDMAHLKELLLSAIIHDINFKNEPSDNFIQKLIEILKEPELKIAALKAYIHNMESSSLQATEIKCYGEPITDLPPVTNALVQQKTENPSLKNYPLKPFIILSSVAAAFVVLGIVLSFTNVFSSDNPDFLLSLFGYILIGAALTYLVYSKLFIPDKRVDKPEDKYKSIEKLNIKPLHLPSQKPEYVNKIFTIPDFNHKIAKTEAAPGLQKQLLCTEQKNEIQDRTVILDGSNLKQPYLRSSDNAETIILTHFPFMLGRLAEQVDHCIKNPAVGKMHAEITKTQEGYFITDMNSRNSTFINGERLEPSNAYRLENGAHLALANEEFVFFEGADHIF